MKRSSQSDQASEPLSKLWRPIKKSLQLGVTAVVPISLTQSNQWVPITYDVVDEDELYNWGGYGIIRAALSAGLKISLSAVSKFKEAIVLFQR